MKTGYPRFFVARIIHQLAMRLLKIHHQREGHSVNGETTDQPIYGRLAMVLDTLRHGQLCHSIMTEWSAARSGGGAPSPDIQVHIVDWDGKIAMPGQEDAGEGGPARNIGDENIILVSYPAELALDAKAFWQHTGFGISSRRATHWLENAPFLSTHSSSVPTSSSLEAQQRVELAKAKLKQRIAAGQSSDGLTVSPSDVFLFPTGMSAIAETAAAIKDLRQLTPDAPYRAVVFGSVLFPSPSLSPKN